MARLFDNPTKTRRIEARWLKEINRRWSEFTKKVIVELPEIKANRIESNPDRQKAYMAYFLQQIDLILLETNGAPNWQSKYQLNAFERAVNRVRDDLRRQGIDISFTAEELIAQQAQIAGLQSIFGTGTVAATHIDELEVLYTRAYESLNGWTDAMAKDVRGIIADGVKEGKGIRELQKEIKERIDVSKARAKLIARTETIQAHQRGTIAETQRLIDETGANVGLKWLTAKDGKVRSLHVAYGNDEPQTPEETFRRVNVSPYNCRCAQRPVVMQ